VDAVVSPASPVPPTRLGAELVASQADYLLLANIAGAAAVTVPVGVAADRMPVGLHIMTRAGNDAMLPAIVASVCAQLQD
jgi:Asp-tRNA(Asn)/Glu-tRNA(Gln) amidotransferase A subunit family amidase